MKKLLFIAACLLIGGTAWSQQEPQFTQFMYNKLILNPAYAGAKDIPSITLLYRNQWFGFNGKPETYLVSFDAPIVKDRVGFGLSVANDRIGIQNTWYASMAYSYKVQFTPDMAIRFGLHATVRYLSVDFADQDALIREQNDASIQSVDGKYNGNFGLGAYLTYKEYYFGISVPRFYPNSIGFNEQNVITAEESPHFYAMAGGLFPVADRIQLKPSILAKYVENSPFDMDINLSLVYDNRLHAGLGYRIGGTGSGDSVDLTAFFQASNQIGIGVGYDYPLSSEVNDQTAGSLEALIRINLTRERLDMANPRFFD